jgi:F-type H+-transporting ATPase subunit a
LAVLAWVVLGLGAALANDEPGHQTHATTDAAHVAGPAHGSGAAHHEPKPMEHVMDSKGHWELFDSIPWLREIPLPGRLTKFMILELIAGALILAIYIPLARRAQTGNPVKGWKDNTFEVLLTFIRDEVAKPSIGEHDADRFVPFLWTLFLFILFNNLLGILPFGGSATASIYVTGALALIVCFAIHGSGMAKLGPIHYIGSFWPHIDLHPAMGIPIKALIFLIEIIGVLVRNGVLAVRLFANMFAGHMVLATILIFIYTARNAGALWYPITFSSVLGIVALSLLEIFVAFLQAYIFVFLTALFMGMAMHPQH